MKGQAYQELSSKQDCIQSRKKKGFLKLLFHLKNHTCSIYVACEKPYVWYFALHFTDRVEGIVFDTHSNV